MKGPFPSIQVNLRVACFGGNPRGHLAVIKSLFVSDEEKKKILPKQTVRYEMTISINPTPSESRNCTFK